MDDPFIQELLDEFSHLGYVVWFGLIEIIAKENGTNITGKVSISPAYLRRKLRTSPTTLRQVLEFCRSNGRLLVTFSEKKWDIDFPKIIEIKDNYMKDLQGACKKPSKHIEEDKDIDKDIDKEEDKDLRETIKEKYKEKEKAKNGKPNKINTQTFLAKYCESFKTLYGKNPVITQKDAGIATRLIGIPEIELIMQRFFTSKDKFITENGHSLNIIESQINKLIANVNKKSGITTWLSQQKEKQYETKQRE